LILLFYLKREVEYQSVVNNEDEFIFPKGKEGRVFEKECENIFCSQVGVEYLSKNAGKPKVSS
jgi:hypothetical protein